MGNSEVGHLTIGAGRVVFQDLMRVNDAIAAGALFENEALAALSRARGSGAGTSTCSASSPTAASTRTSTTCGRCSSWRGARGWPSVRSCTRSRTGATSRRTSAACDLAELVAEGARIATVIGRYYAMDRDERWERTERALRGDPAAARGAAGPTPSRRSAASYEAGVTDEFIEPVVLPGPAARRAGTRPIFFNFRPDRARQLSERLLEAGVDLTTMTRYREDFPCPVAFPEQDVARDDGRGAGREHGVRQLHVAETEKYAHVTYFFNGGREEREWEGETRILVPSPRDVPTYDQKPEMSALEVDAALRGEIAKGYRFAIVNFANPDMVGHTGVIPAVVRAVETVDACLGRVVAAVEELGGVCLVTADHGNAEQMLESDGAARTRRTRRTRCRSSSPSRGGAPGRRRAGRPRPHVPRPARPPGAGRNDRPESAPVR